MRGNPAATLVATEDGKIVGYCAPRMEELAIHPDHRRRGHGRRLIEAWLDRKRERGELDLVLHGPDRPAAAAFIAALGLVRRSSPWLFELAPSVWAKAEHEPRDGTDERRGFVSFIGVVPAWRGRGLGRELLRWAIAFNRDAGAGTVELNVEAANDRALGLYRATGFSAEVEWPHYAPEADP